MLLNVLPCAERAHLLRVSLGRRRFLNVTFLVASQILALLQRDDCRLLPAALRAHLTERDAEHLLWRGASWRDSLSLLQVRRSRNGSYFGLCVTQASRKATPINVVRFSN